MDTKGFPEKSNPFAALIGVSSLIAAVLYVAGFSYRWAYYYNFGVQHVVFKLGVQSFLIAAMELVRTPGNLLLALLVIFFPLILLNGILGLLRYCAHSSTLPAVRSITGFFVRMLGLDCHLVVDALRTALILYATYMLGSHLGYETFRSHVANTIYNPLPAVSVVIEGKDGGKAPALVCGGMDMAPLQVIGDRKRIEKIRSTLRTCNRQDTRWRLLYRDDESIYVFESVEKPKGRPLTLILPNNDRTSIVME